MTNDTATDRNQILDLAVDIGLRLALIASLVILCVIIVRPFTILILWAIILAVALAGPFEKLAGLVGRRGWAATLMSLLGIAFLAIPAYLTGTSLVDSVKQIREQLAAGTLEAPPVNEAVRNVPVAGDRIYEAWTLAHDDIQAAVVQFEPQLRAAGEWVIGFLTGVGGAALQTLVSLIIASVFLTYREGAVASASRVARRMAPVRGDDYVTMAGATINSVTQGVLGVAAIQALAGAVVLNLFGIPFASLIALVLFVTAVVQVPGLIILALPIVWGVGNLSGITMIAFVISAIVVGVLDAPLKALLLGRGLPIPTWVILIGAIGGMVSMGMMGLFVGAVVLGIGYRLGLIWTGGSPGVEDIAEALDDSAADSAAPA